MTSINKVVLITGSNSGIGNASAKALVRAGFITYGGVRRSDSFQAVQNVGAIPILLDVTSEQSMVDAVQQIHDAHGAVDVLINNAGYGQMGAVEEVNLGAWRAQFETNVLGLVRMTQLVLPAMRDKHSGLIINISSAGGEFTFPLAGAYHASKYAVESLSDALRFEAMPHGIKVVLIQPGPVLTPLAKATAESIYAADNSPYQGLINAFQRTSQSTSGYLKPDDVARVIVSAVQTEHPRSRYKIGMIGRAMPLMHHLLPDSLWDKLVARFY